MPSQSTYVDYSNQWRTLDRIGQLASTFAGIRNQKKAQKEQRLMQAVQAGFESAQDSGRWDSAQLANNLKALQKVNPELAGTLQEQVEWQRDAQSAANAKYSNLRTALGTHAQMLVDENPGMSYGDAMLGALNQFSPEMQMQMMEDPRLKELLPKRFDPWSDQLPADVRAARARDKGYLGPEDSTASRAAAIGAGTELSAGQQSTEDENLRRQQRHEDDHGVAVQREERLQREGEAQIANQQRIREQAEERIKMARERMAQGGGKDGQPTRLQVRRSVGDALEAYTSEQFVDRQGNPLLKKHHIQRLKDSLTAGLIKNGTTAEWDQRVQMVVEILGEEIRSGKTVDQAVNSLAGSQ